MVDESNTVEMEGLVSFCSQKAIASAPRDSIMLKEENKISVTVMYTY
jgi:hypothetical protein